jgi:phosphoglycerol transferase MdoB-like AlkP superfamily enzyme
LKSLGYRTICVHPYHGSFYRRDTVLPALGFDEFIDIKAFKGAERVGAFVGDQAVGRYVSSLLERDDPRPLFIHVITMENHGPLHMEAVTDDDARAVLNGPMPKGCEDLVAYARHLKNADAMFSELRQTMLRNGRPAGLCVFGDHVPIMPKVYRELGAVSGSTDGLIWSVEAKAGEPSKQKITSLAADFLSRFALLANADKRSPKNIVPNGTRKLRDMPADTSFGKPVVSSEEFI